MRLQLSGTTRAIALISLLIITVFLLMPLERQIKMTDVAAVNTSVSEDDVYLMLGGMLYQTALTVALLETAVYTELTDKGWSKDEIHEFLNTTMDFVEAKMEDLDAYNPDVDLPLGVAIKMIEDEDGSFTEQYVTDQLK